MKRKKIKFQLFEIPKKSKIKTSSLEFEILKFGISFFNIGI